MIDWMLSTLKIQPTIKLKGREDALRDQFIRLESQVGGRVFGAIPAGRQRLFYCRDEHTWVWEEQTDDEIVTTKYDVRDDGIYKSHNDGKYNRVGEHEVIRLYEAALRYRDVIKREVYQYI